MRRGSSLVARLRRQQSGASAAEFALILPLLALLLTGAIDIGGLAWTKMQVDAAARAGASYALTWGFSEAEIRTAIEGATNLQVTATVPDSWTLGCPDASVGIVAPTAGCTPGRYVTVEASADYHTLFGWPGIPSSMNLVSSATVRIL